MKRPQGVRPPEPSERRSTPSPTSPEPDTEPIAVVTPAVRRPRPEPTPEPEQEGPAAAPRASASRRALAQAARARRRYERGEVKRFTKRSRHRRAVLLTVAGAIVALIAAVAIAAYSPLMAVRTIDVAGATRVDPDAVRSALSGEMGVPLTLVDRDEVRSALAGFPLIQSYSIEASPPNTLLVRIVERTPVGVLAQNGGFVLVDAAGVVIEKGTSAQAGYAVITTPSGNATGDAFSAVARVMRVLPSTLDGQVTAASASTADDVVLTLASGASVVWGSADDSALKAEVLARLMAATDPDTVVRYDVSSPASAVVLPN